MRVRIVAKVTKVIVVCAVLGILAGCAGGGSQLRPAKYEKDGKPASGDCRVMSTFQF